MLALTSPSKPHPAIFSVPPGTEKLKSYSRQSPDSSNMLHVFNNETYTDFRTANKHVLIPNYVI